MHMGYERSSTYCAGSATQSDRREDAQQQSQRQSFDGNQHSERRCVKSDVWWMVVEESSVAEVENAESLEM